MATHAGTGLQDVDTRMHIADADDLVNIHIVVTADAAELVGKGDIHGTVGVLNHLGHLGGADIGNDYLTLTETGVIFLHLLTNLAAVGTDGAVVVQQLIHHITRDDALRGMNEVDVLTNLEAVGLNHRAHKLVDGARRDGALYNHSCTLGAYLHHFLDGCNDIAGIHLLGELVVGCGDGDNVHVCLLILSSELNACLDSGSEEFIQTVFLESGLACVERGYEVFVVVGADHFNTMGGHHQGRG